MSDLIIFAKEYGALGMVILACFWYIVQKDKSHEAERKVMMDQLAKQNDDNLTITTRQHKEALKVTAGVTTILSEVSTLIKNRTKE